MKKYCIKDYIIIFLFQYMINFFLFRKYYILYLKNSHLNLLDINVLHYNII